MVKLNASQKAVVVPRTTPYLSMFLPRCKFEVVPAVADYNDSTRELAVRTRAAIAPGRNNRVLGGVAREVDPPRA